MITSVKMTTSRQTRRRDARMMRKAVRQAVHMAGLEWIDWDLESVEMSGDIAIRAESYRPRTIFDVPPWYADGDINYVRSPQGSWAYTNRATMGAFPHFKAKGASYFSDYVIVPGLIDLWLSRGYEEPLPKTMPEHERFVRGAVWMTITPAEMISQRSGIHRAKGKVLIGGLGLGWFLEEVCKKDDVEEVVVVEQSEELLDWYGYRLCREQPKVREVICGDVYGVAEHFPEHQLLLDIWPNYSAAGKDERLVALRRTAGPRVWAWGMN